ncbi:uncharacterized protein K452DRAFT_314831 [Aplosporella prunicola CBS 121167]|uniref:Uncharacterized protein n=1 Tax=Aplosporella prunicola CBS 121167 TaxID=1176127 RepID=A0A6A6BRE1_9PEZI|nr:uncharacterized protein K452DRAFT_314831 [Aplosporella prunicola CBS 121167]KAF2146580.1 hypothetical protein K452DRAFT_314831 [Aplosporella prunicola CBS 121167]
MRFQWPGFRKTSEKPTGQPSAQVTEDDRSPGSLRPLWIPFFLRRTNLILFICVFLAIGIALGALYGVSVRNSGLCNSNTKYYYLWTYGPTAVSTLLAALWAQVEYRSKQMAPWNLMAQEPQPVGKSLLLDYTDPMNIISLFTSAKEKHFIVTTAIAGTFFIKLITVLSSGLFIALPTALKQSHSPLIARNVFYGNADAGVSAKSASVAYGTLAYSLQYPEGTTPLYAYQSFDSPAASSFIVTAEVNVFSADLTCEVGNVIENTVDTTTGEQNPLLEPIPRRIQTYTEQANVWISTDTCDNLFVAVQEGQSMSWNGSTCTNLENGDDANRFIIIFGDWTSTTRPFERDISALSIRDGSSNGVSNNDVSTEVIDTSTDDSLVSIDDPNDSNDDQLVSIDDPDTSDDASITIEAPEASTTMPNIINNGQSTSLSASTNKPSTPTTSSTADDSGSLTAANFTISESTFRPKVALSCKPHYKIQRASVTLTKDDDGYWSPNISIPVGGNSSQLAGISGWTLTKGFAQSIYEAEEEINEHLLDFLRTAGPEGDVTSDAAVLNGSLSQIFQRVAVQYARSYLMRPTQEDLSGEVVLEETRLYVRTVPFSIIEATLAFLIGIAGFLYVKSPTVATSRDPSSIGGLSTILARSPELMTSLEGLGTHELQEFRNRLQHREFKTSVQPHSSSPFAITESGTSDMEPASSVPLTEDKIKWWRPFAVSITGRILIAVSPIAVVIALTLLLAHSQDKNGIATIDKSLAVHYAWTYIPVLVMVGVQLLFGMLDYAIKIFNPYHNLRVGAAPARTSIMENHLAKLGLHALFVAVGKLQYTVVAAGFAMMLSSFLTIVTGGLFYTEYTQTHQEVQVQRMGWFNTSHYVSSEGVKQANLVLAYNLTEPTWTHDQLAFPKLQVRANGEVSKNASELQVVVPSLRGNANCSVSSPEFMQWAIDNPNLSEGSIPTINSTVTIMGNKDWSGTGYFGHWNSIIMDFEEAPPIVASIGRAVNKTITEVTALSCWPYIEQLDVSVTFNLPSYTISNEKPPVPDKSTSKVFSNSGPTSFDDFTLANPNTGDRTSEELFGVFGLAVYGKDGVPISELIGDTNIHKLNDAVSRVYSRVVAQIMDCRRAASDDASDINGTMVSTDTLRLKQSTISTHILQGLLLAMLVCSAVTFCIMDTRKLLPKNPCSIAAVASLLAGSDLMTSNIIPSGSEWMSDRELEKKVFKGLLFRLGWWQDEDEPGVSRFGIDIGKAGGGA